MNRRTAIAVFCVLPRVHGQKKSGPKGPEVELLKVSARVEGNHVDLDARVKNVADRPIRKLTIIFEILDPSNHVLTKQQGPIEEPVLEPEEEGSFYGRIAWHARTHAFRVGFEDESGRELRAGNTGPFPVE